MVCEATRHPFAQTGGRSNLEQSERRATHQGRFSASGQSVGVGVPQSLKIKSSCSLSFLPDIQCPEISHQNVGLGYMLHRVIQHRSSRGGVVVEQEQLGERTLPVKWACRGAVPRKYIQRTTCQLLDRMIACREAAPGACTRV